MIWLVGLLLLALLGAALAALLRERRGAARGATETCAVCGGPARPRDGHTGRGVAGEPRFVCDRCTWPAGF